MGLPYPDPKITELQHLEACAERVMDHINLSSATTAEDKCIGSSEEVSTDADRIASPHRFNSTRD